MLYSLRPSHPERMLAAVTELQATFFGDDRKLRQAISHIRSKEHELLATVHGRVDYLGTIEDDTTFEDVAHDVDWMELDGTPVRVLSLPRLIEMKKKLTRPKDQLALLQMQATLQERERPP